jgi:maltose/maltodextrin transport system permease protein
MILFIMFPLVYTIGLSFTNYSAKNQLSLERAQSVLLDQTYQSAQNYPFTLYHMQNGYRLVIRNGEQLLATPAFSLGRHPAKQLALTPIESPQGWTKESLKTVIQHRDTLSGLKLVTQDEQTIRMNGLRRFSAIFPKYQLLDDGMTLRNQQNGELLKPNMDIGFCQPVDQHGQFDKTPISPGFIVKIGTANFERVWQDDGIKEPFISIFMWTVVFSALTVGLTLIIGLVLAASCSGKRCVDGRFIVYY